MQTIDIVFVVFMVTFMAFCYGVVKVFELNTVKYLVKSSYEQYKGVTVYSEKSFSCPNEAERFYREEVKRISRTFNLEIVEVVESIDGMTTYFVYGGENIAFVEAEELEG